MRLGLALILLGLVSAYLGVVVTPMHGRPFELDVALWAGLAVAALGVLRVSYVLAQRLRRRRKSDS